MPLPLDTPAGRAAALADYERIWLEPRCADGKEEGRTWCKDNVWPSGCEDCGLPAVEYVRADLASRPSAAVLDVLREARMYVAMERGEAAVGGYQPGVDRAEPVLAAIDALVREEGE